MDSKLTFEDHVARLFPNASNKLRALSLIPLFMDQGKLRYLMRAFITASFNIAPVHLFIYFRLFTFESLLHIGRQVHSGLFSDFKNNNNNNKCIKGKIKNFQYKFFSIITFPHHHMDLTSNMQQT